MADQLTDDQISEFKEAFSLFDKDGDDVIFHCFNWIKVRGAGGALPTVEARHRLVGPP